MSPRFEANVELLPRSSQDTTLTALAQLGALRLNVQRCMISLFDRRSQYILTEATRTLSLQDDRVHLAGDALWLGSSVIPREDGICHFVTDDSHLNAGQSDTGNACAFVVDDLTEDDRFKTRHYVTNAPRLRFFAGAPIRSRRGIVIGAFSVSDGKTRPEGLTPQEIRFMTDTAMAVMNHLDMVRSHEQNRRGANMIAGLGDFVEGEIFPSSSLRRKSRLDVDKVEEEDVKETEEKLRNSAIHARRASQKPDHQDKNLVECGKSPAPSGKSILSSGDLTDCIVIEPPAPPKRKRDNEGMTLTSGTKDILSRAARVLQQSLDVQGVTFFDASAKSYAGLVRNADDRPSDIDSSSFSEADETGDSDNLTTEQSSTDTDEFTTSDVLGSSLHDVEQPMGAMRETFLRSLLRNYPQGAIFNVDENGSVSSSEGSDSSSGASVSREIVYRRNEGPKVHRRWKQQKRHRISLKEENKGLMKTFPSARCVTLFPLWDSRRNRWFSGLFLWTRSPRSFSLGGELAYLYAFSNSIMAEIHRLDMELANRAHATLVGSISHELRSPLHGILGSTELLVDSSLTPSQSALVNTVEHCGRSLLDIINNMLDFAKINQFARNSRSAGLKPSPPKRLQQSAPKKANGVVNLISDVQLDAVLEEVAESVFAGHCFSSKNRTLAQASAPTSDQEGELVRTSPTERPLSAFNQSLTVIYDVAPDSWWLFETQAGAWRRVLMNLFGNALKYTESGYILVSIKSSAPTSVAKARRLSRDESVEVASVALTVKDTGQGIDKEYLQSNVFKPFSQENSLSPGSGLGLSIVKQTVLSLGGKIDISSTKGVGTEVTVRADLTRTPNPETTNGEIGLQKDLDRGKSVGLVGFDTDQNEETLGLLRSSLVKMYQSHFGMEVGFASVESPGAYGIYVTRQTHLDEIERICQQSEQHVPAVLVICSTPQTAQKLSSAGQRPFAVYEFISQPCGPCTMGNALQACVDRQKKEVPAKATNGATENKFEVQHVEQPKPGFPLPVPSKALQNGTFKSADLDISPNSTVATITTSSIDDGAVTEISATLETTRIVPSVLLVDDNKVNLQLLVAVMKKAKLPYFAATNGLEALDMYKAHVKDIRVILMGTSSFLNGEILTNQTSRCQ